MRFKQGRDIFEVAQTFKLFLNRLSGRQRVQDHVVEQVAAEKAFQHHVKGSWRRFLRLTCTNFQLLQLLQRDLSILRLHGVELKSNMSSEQTRYSLIEGETGSSPETNASPFDFVCPTSFSKAFVPLRIIKSTDGLDPIKSVLRTRCLLRHKEIALAIHASTTIFTEAQASML